MQKLKINAYRLLEKLRLEKPVVHHLTNWVTIYDCASVVKLLGASPVMAHAREEVGQMAQIASSLVLNIGTLTVDFVEAMKLAAKSANKKGIPVVLDVCGAGATRLRDEKSFELLDMARIDIIKGNSSEIARVAGCAVRTKGVDALQVDKDLLRLAKRLARQRECTVVITGKEDIVTNGEKSYLVKNGHPLMTDIVGTGCMATSIIGAFAAIEKDLVYAAASGLVCFEVAAELAAKNSSGAGQFKERLFDALYNLKQESIDRMQRVEIASRS
jgi:hydroxyethylthiazole kinase